jgi:RNA polymerase sigma-70 factor (ECF subfamily)
LTHAGTQAEFETAEAAAGAEEAFRLLYHRTARPLRAYLRKMLGDRSLADDLLQETFLRFLGAKLPDNMTDEHQKNYLFRIATNLLRDQASKAATLAIPEELTSSALTAHQIEGEQDLLRALERIKPKERQLLWLAYVEMFDHSEIAAMVGAKAPSIRPMLARARHNLAEVLRGLGLVQERR